MTWTTIALVVSIWVNVSLVAGWTWSHSRLREERKRCRHQCPLIETCKRQLESLNYAWSQLDNAAQAKRKAG